jgi:hypothetical protein
MAQPLVIYNASTGSDANSGSGTTVVSGTNGDISGTTLTLNETKDFSAANDDGSDVLYFVGNAGDRHLFAVSSFNPSAASCTSITLVQSATAVRTGSNWAVGGKRQTLENDSSNKDGNDVAAGWIMEFDAGTYTITAAIDLLGVGGTTTTGRTTLRVGSGARPLITASVNTTIVKISSGRFELNGLKLENTWAGTNQRMVDIGTDGDIHITDCIVSTPNSAAAVLVTGSSNIWSLGIFDSYLDGGATGVQLGNDSARAVICGCIITGATRGIHCTAASNSSNMTCVNSLIFDCVTGIQSDDDIRRNEFYSGNTIVDNSGDGILIAVSANARSFSILNNVIAFNGGYGINFADAGQDVNKMMVDFNAFYSNTSGARNNATAGANDVTLSADPFTARGSDDYRLNNDAGGGAACKGAAFPGTFPDGT